MELDAYVSHPHIFTTLMMPLEHIATKVDNTAEYIWEIRGNIRSAPAVVPLFQEAVWICRQTQIHVSVPETTG